MDDASTGIRNECHCRIYCGFHRLRPWVWLHGKKPRWRFDELARGRSSLAGFFGTECTECLAGLFHCSGILLLGAIVAAVAQADFPQNLSRVSQLFRRMRRSEVAAARFLRRLEFH